MSAAPPGAYCIEAARRYPHLQAVVYDIAPALAIAREKIDEAGLADRITTREGDFFSEELPSGADVILLSMILHDWGPDKNRAIPAKCFRALPPGGALIVSELMMDDDKTGPLAAALESICMLIEIEGYEAWLAEAGFRDLARLALRRTAFSSATGRRAMRNDREEIDVSHYSARRRSRRRGVRADHRCGLRSDRRPTQFYS